MSINWKVAIAALAILGMVPSTGRAQEGGVRKAGEKLDEAGRAVKRRLKEAGEAVRDRFQRTKAAVHNMEVGARVYSRLHWDKALTDASVEVDVKEGVATLRGTVANAAAKAKAVTLTRDTVGVDQVLDQLGTLPPPRVPPTPPAGTTPRP